VKRERTPDRRAKSGARSNASPFKQSGALNSQEKVKRERAPDRRAKSGVHSNVSPFKQSVSGDSSCGGGCHCRD
jgi:hypothetical protein